MYNLCIHAYMRMYMYVCMHMCMYTSMYMLVSVKQRWQISGEHLNTEINVD